MSPTVTTNIAIGAATVTVGTYAAAGAGGGSMTDVGHTKGPTTLNVQYEDYEISSEQSFGALRKIPQNAAVKLKVLMSESVMNNIRTALRQPTANVSGTEPNRTLLVGAPAEQYHQIVVATRGTGGTTVATRTMTFWKCIVESLGEVQYTKSGEQVFEVVFHVMYDDSVATAEKFFKYVDSGGVA